MKTISDTAKQEPQAGKLLALGNAKILDDGKKVGVDVKPGDTVFSWKYSRLG